MSGHEDRALIRCRTALRKAIAHSDHIYTLPEIVDTLHWLDRRLLAEIKNREAKPR